VAAGLALAAVTAGGTGLTGCAGGAGSGDGTVTVMTWAPENDGADSHVGMPALAEAIGKSLADSGGLDGHPVKVETCNEKNTAAGAAACADRAVSDQVVAVVGSYSQYGSTFLPTLEAAGIPYIGGYGVTPDEFTSPISYPVNGGTPALLAGAGQQLASAGCERVALVRPDNEAGDTMPAFLAAGLGPSIPLKDLPTAPGQTDYTSVASEAIGDDASGSCVLGALDAGSMVTFYDSFRRLNHRQTQLAALLGAFQQSLVDSEGGANGPLEGALATGWYPPDSSPVWNGLHDLVKKYAFTDNRIDTQDPDVQTTWVAYQVLESVVGRIKGPVTAKSVRIAFDETGPVSTGGATPPLSWQDKDLLASSVVPRAVDTEVTFQIVADGQLSDERKGLVDVRDALVSVKGANSASSVTIG